MFYAIISFLGLIIGTILSREFKNELKDIKGFIKIISFIATISLLLALISLAKINLVLLIGLFTGLMTGYIIKNNYLYYGSLLTLLNLNNNIKMFFSMLIFILGLGYPALNNINKKRMFINLILFALPFTLVLVNFNHSEFIIGFCMGGLAFGIRQFNK